MEETNKIIRKNISENLIIAITVVLYFFIVNFSFIRADEKIIINGIKIISIIVLFLCIGIFEMAYHKDSGKIAINGIEILILAINTLISWNVTNKNNISFGTYMIYSSLAFSIYYILKSMIIYTVERRKYYKSLSDIHEIVKKEPTKKEAKKRMS